MTTIHRTRPQHRPPRLAPCRRPCDPVYALSPQVAQRLLGLFVVLCIVVLAATPHVDHLIALTLAAALWGSHGWYITRRRGGLK